MDIIQNFLNSVLSTDIPVGFVLGKGVWDTVMSIILLVLPMSPQKYSPDAWGYVSGTLYPWFAGAGAVLLNLFCLLGFVRQASNIKENITTEMWIELLIKVVLANVVMKNGITLFRSFFKAAGLTVVDIVVNTPEIPSDPADLGSLIFTSIFGIIYFISAFLCGLKVLLEVLGRYFQIYVLVAVAPIAMATWAGGRGFEDTVYAWIRTFLTTVFQIVIIAIALIICRFISGGLNGIAQNLTFVSPGFMNACVGMVTMFLTATAVTSSDELLKRAFNLR